MRQSGFLYKYDPRDYILGASPLQGEILNENGDWRDFLPKNEKQYNYSFDTMACVTFSALNIIETTLNFLIRKKKLTTKQIKELKELGFIEKDKLNFSDRFTAIMSGTMPNGNYFQNVWDSIRKDGLLPEKDLPFIGKTWEEYHNKTDITETMKVKAKKILDILEFGYEWVPVTNSEIELSDSLKEVPIQVAVTATIPRHAIMLPKIDYEFETYEPYLRKRGRSVAYAMKAVIKVKKEVSDKVVIVREKSNLKQTTGTLTANLGGSTFICKTLELSDNNNIKNISCIPKGIYKVQYSFSPRFMKYTYEILGVPNRTGIRFHSANYHYQLNGCIALGDNLVDINNDGQLDTVNSRATILAFEKFLNKKPFTLEIK